MAPKQTVVAIVGGGPVGLVCSILLSLNGISHVLFDRQPGTAIHPKAVGINQRTMEIFRKIGVENEVLRHAAPADMSGHTAWYTSFGPRGRQIVSRDAWGGGQYQDEYEQASPSRIILLPQIRLDPILQRRASSLNPNCILFGHEVTSLDEHPDHVIVHYHKGKGVNSSEERTMSATYVLGADGGRFLAKQLNIPMRGLSDIVDMVSAHIRAPISLHRQDQRDFIHWFISPELGGSLKTGYVYHLGPYPIDPKTEEWCFACARLPHEQEQPFDARDMLKRMHRTLQIPDLDVELLSLTHWHVNAVIAEHYRSSEGRIFLVGDAAHRVPPWGALGMNSGIQDADNLVWKLALSLKNPGLPLDSLLDTYDSERRPIGERIARTSLESMEAHALILDMALGLSPEQDEMANVMAMEQYFDQTNEREGAAKRQDVHRAMDLLDLEFRAHGAEAGWFYNFEYDGDYGRSGDIRNPQVNEDGKMELLYYRNTTRPGSQLPHAWLAPASGGKATTSTRDLIRFDKLVLLATSSAWKVLRVPFVEAVIVNSDDGDYVASPTTWRDTFTELSHTGALLVRPDGIIAYRFTDDEILHHSSRGEVFGTIVNKVLGIQARS